MSLCQRSHDDVKSSQTTLFYRHFFLVCADKIIWFSITWLLSITFQGHELPYAIRMNHIRTLHEYTHDENDNQYDQTSSIDYDGKVQFVLKKAKKGNARNNIGKLDNLGQLGVFMIFTNPLWIMYKLPRIEPLKHWSWRSYLRLEFNVYVHFVLIIVFLRTRAWE